ncbi:exonuclease 3'-5' domain-containing protein 2 [Exaiptasia diaphana]|uniref:3'-5' exonuclease domain-containing protein n=1 Tax=Exaiptasia diaphana TaxID=2652724 RepID=A0A913XAT5_EXADI|nr:exonuclease 3'-5' domain-containing protein 2 [Exaiptasia diaphana]KXJ13471.1 Exonuclease 3'-5' domain-containing protein 2 [Exaiptasia diaphana]
MVFNESRLSLSSLVVAILVCFMTVMTVAILQVSRWLTLRLLKQIQKVFRRDEVVKLAKVFVLSNPSECEQALRAYKEKYQSYPFSMNFLGLDCEWVNDKGIVTHPVALLQIATPLNDCFLIRLCKFEGILPRILKEILEDRNILKFGVGIQDDAKKLNGMYGINVSGFVDLRHVVLRCQSHKDNIVENKQGDGSTKMGLAAISKRYLGVEMEKSWRVRCSNWEAEHLSEKQIEYAAHDAIVAIHLFLTFVKNKSNKRSFSNFLENYSPNIAESDNTFHHNETDSGLEYEMPDTQFTISLNKYETDSSKGHIINAKDLLSDQLFFQRATSLCKGIIDLPFKSKLLKAPSNSIKKETASKTNSIKKPFKRGTTLRKSPLYTKCQLIAPDGAMLCAFDQKKAQWYLDKGIGELVCEDPFTVKLKFEPSARPDDGDSYYLTFKQNVCVVCGGEENYSRKNIVPHEYRKYFPDCMKDHHSHDVVLMCPECHRLSSIYDEQLRQRLASEYEAPVGNKEFSKFIQDPEKMKVKSAAKALLNSPDKIPTKRKEELSQILHDYYEGQHLTSELLKEASNMEVQKENRNFKCHGEVVIQKVKEQKRLLEFEKMWRVHFMDTMCPKYLPDFWSVNHRLDRMKVALDKIDLQ